MRIAKKCEANNQHTCDFSPQIIVRCSAFALPMDYHVQIFLGLLEDMIRKQSLHHVHLIFKWGIDIRIENSSMVLGKFCCESGR